MKNLRRPVRELPPFPSTQILEGHGKRFRVSRAKSKLRV
jgi:hypothetical protein